MAEKHPKFQFDREKAIEVVLYIVSKVSDPTYHSICKILYNADKFSLSQYGRLICADTYYAMKFGAVPSNTYRLLKEAETPHRQEIGFGSRYGREIVKFRSPNMDLFSQSDIECLDQAIAQEGRKSFGQRTRDNHDEVYWEAWNKRGDQNRSLMTIESIVKSMENGDQILDFLLHRHEDE